MHRTVSFTQCIQLWWRFALFFIGVLLLCSVVTQLILSALDSLSIWLQLGDFSNTIPSSEMTTMPATHTIFMHVLGVGSVLFFLFAQISIFYILLNYNQRVRDILYGRQKNPYSEPIHKATHRLLR